MRLRGFHAEALFDARDRRRGHVSEQRATQLGLLAPRRDAAGKQRDGLNRRRQRPDDVDARQGHELAQLLKAEFHRPAPLPGAEWFTEEVRQELTQQFGQDVTTQGGQVHVFRNAAAHLRPGGLFLIEVGVPDLRRLPPGQDTVPFTVAPGREGGGYVGFDQYDIVTQRFTSNHVTVSADGKGRFWRIPFRYAWPAEMDLMARIAGLSLKYRWAGWDHSAFTAESTTHVSVWQKP